MNEDLTNKLVSTQDKLKLVLKETEKMEKLLEEKDKKLEDMEKK